jgi:hypothetical protein
MEEHGQLSFVMLRVTRNAGRPISSIRHATRPNNTTNGFHRMMIPWSPDMIIYVQVRERF